MRLDLISPVAEAKTFSVESHAVRSLVPRAFQSCECKRILCVRLVAHFVFSEFGRTRRCGGEILAEAAARRNGGKENAEEIENGQKRVECFGAAGRVLSQQ